MNSQETEIAELQKELDIIQEKGFKHLKILTILLIISLIPLLFNNPTLLFIGLFVESFLTILVIGVGINVIRKVKKIKDKELIIQEKYAYGND